MLEAIAIAIVQGLTEFLPISSSGHLILARWLFGWDDPGLAFDAAVHVGTLAAILVAFRRQIRTALRGLPANSGLVDDLRPRRLIWLGLLGTIPIVIVGGLLYETLESELRNATSASAFLLLTGVILKAALWRAEQANTTQGEAQSKHQCAGRSEDGSLAQLNPRQSIMIGAAQSLAVVPGLSRAGLCIAAAVWSGHSQEAATRWAFWLAIPAIAGAGILVAVSLLDGHPDPAVDLMISGVVVSFIVALAAIKALLRLAHGRRLWPFHTYCLVIGAAVLIARAAGI